MRKTTKNKKSKIKNIKPHGKEIKAMTKNYFTTNHFTKTIEGSKRAFDRAGKRIEPEYSELLAHMNDNHDYKLVIKENTKKTTYKGLDIDFIREYISLYDADRLPEFEAISKKFKFPTVKKWFLENYKNEGETFNVKKEMKKIRESKTERNIAEARKSVKIKVSAVSQKMDA